MEAARVFFGLAAPLVVSWERGWFKERPWLAIIFTLMYGGCAIAPYSDEVKPWAALAAGVLVALGAAILLHLPGTLSVGFSLTTPVTSRPVAARKKAGAFVLVVAAITALWAAAVTTMSLGTQLLLSDRASGSCSPRHTPAHTTRPANKGKNVGATRPVLAGHS